VFEDIIVKGLVQPTGAAVAILYSETTDIWREAEVGFPTFSAIFDRKCRNCPFFVHFDQK